MECSSSAHASQDKVNTANKGASALRHLDLCDSIDVSTSCFYLHQADLTARSPLQDLPMRWLDMQAAGLMLMTPRHKVKLASDRRRHILTLEAAVLHAGSMAFLHAG